MEVLVLSYCQSLLLSSGSQSVDALSHVLFVCTTSESLALSLIVYHRVSAMPTASMSLCSSEKTSREARRIAASRLFSYIEVLSVKDLLYSQPSGNGAASDPAAVDWVIRSRKTSLLPCVHRRLERSCRPWQDDRYPASAHVKLIHTIAIGAESDVLCMVPKERVAFLRCMGSTSRLFF